MTKPSRVTFEERLNHMVESLRVKILSGKYPSDSYIPSILQLSKEYQLSINSVQKGLDILLQESLIERIPRVGIRVSSLVENQVINLSIGYYTTLLEEMDLHGLIEEFEALHPSIKINLIPLHFNDYVETTEAYLKNEMVDAVAINHLNYLHFSDQYEDLSELFEPIEPGNAIYPYLNDAFIRNDQLFVQPIIFSAVVLCYNKSFFTEHNIANLPSSWKWEEFIKLLEQVENIADSKLSFYFYPSTWNRWPIFILQSGINFTEQDVDWSSHAIMDGIDTCHHLIHRQNTFSLLLSSNDTNVEKLFIEQSVPIMMTTYYRLNHLKDVSFEFDIAPIPYVHEPKTLLLPIGFAVNQRSSKKEAARTFINFLSSYSSQLHIRRNTYSIPALQQAAEWEGTEAIYRPEHFQMFKHMEEQFSVISDLHLSEAEMKQLLNVMNMYWTGLQNKEYTIAQLANIGKK